MTTTYNVSSIAALNAAIEAINNANPGTGNYQININSAISLTSNLAEIDLPTGTSLTIAGTNGSGGAQVQTISSPVFVGDVGSKRGFFVYSGDVTIDNLSVVDMNATGSSGGAGGGGGAGLGGGLFVAGSDGQAVVPVVNLDNVTFSHDAAFGGFGGSGDFIAGRGGAGGTAGVADVNNAGTGGNGGDGGAGGAGGFGAGAGGAGANSLGIGGTDFGGGGVGDGGGGGGLGAGGDIFVQQGGTLIIDGGSVAAGTVSGGQGGSAPPGLASIATSGAAGQGYGATAFSLKAIRASRSALARPPARQRRSAATSTTRRVRTRRLLGIPTPATRARGVSSSPATALSSLADTTTIPAPPRLRAARC
jgi:hypothetical protein